MESIPQSLCSSLANLTMPEASKCISASSIATLGTFAAAFFGAIVLFMPSALSPFSRSARAYAALDYQQGDWRPGTAAEWSQGWTVIRTPSFTHLFDVATAREVLNGRSLLFVGDSLTMHRTRTLVHYLLSGSWVLPDSGEPSPEGYVGIGKLLYELQQDADSLYSENRNVHRIFDCGANISIPDFSTKSFSDHWWITESSKNTERLYPGTRIDVSTWRGMYDFTDEDMAVSGVRECLTEPFLHAVEDRAARHNYSVDVTECVSRYSRRRCDEEHVFRVPVAPAVTRLLDELQPDVLIINNGHWYFNPQHIPPLATIDALAEVLRTAIAKRTGSLRPLRAIWVTTTATRDPRSNVSRSAQYALESALVAAGAEVFDAYDLTRGLTASDELVRSAFYDDLHFGPAVYAEMDAALLEHLALGWRSG